MKQMHKIRPNSVFARWLTGYLDHDSLLGDFALDAFRDHKIWAINDLALMREFISGTLPRDAAVDIRRSVNHAFFRGELYEPLNGRGRKRFVSSKQRRKRKTLSPKQRFLVMKENGYRCQICGITAKDNAHVRLEIDHKVPIANGGSNQLDNLWVLCFECNRGKSVHSL